MQWHGIRDYCMMRLPFHMTIRVYLLTPRKSRCWQCDNVLSSHSSKSQAPGKDSSRVLYVSPSDPSELHFRGRVASVTWIRRRCAISSVQSCVSTTKCFGDGLLKHVSSYAIPTRHQRLASKLCGESTWTHRPRLIRPVRQTFARPVLQRTSSPPLNSTLYPNPSIPPTRPTISIEHDPHITTKAPNA